jgi:hypothetical protein
MDKNLQKQSKEATRKLIGAVLCDFVEYMESIKDPFIVGGQYPNDKIRNVFLKWLDYRNFNIANVSDSSKLFFKLCEDNVFAGLEKTPSTTPPPSSENNAQKDGWQEEEEDWKEDEFNDIQPT